MALVNPKSGDFGARQAILHFGDGFVTHLPQEYLSDSASPFLGNVIFDKKNCLTKIYGTTAYFDTNQFTLPILNLYVFKMSEGEEILMVQDKSNLYYVRPEDTEPTLLLSGLPLRRMSFTNYKGRLYMWNGHNNLKYWDGGGLVREYTANEQFQYLTTYNQRLWAARSSANPGRVIYTHYNYCNFDHYYNVKTNYIDFGSAGNDYSPVMAIVPFANSLLVFKVNSIFRFSGDPSTSIDFDLVSQGIGTIDGGSVCVHNNRVYFAWKDGIYVLGETGVIASPEDNRLRTQNNVVRITTEIDDFWADNFSLPDPNTMRQKVWSSDDFDDFTLTKMQVTEPAFSNNPKVIISSLFPYGSSVGCLIKNDAVGSISDWVDLKNTYGSDQYWSQIFKITTQYDYSIPHCALFYMKINGTLPTTQELRVSVVATDVEGNPDTSKSYAEGKVLGSELNGVWELKFDNGTGTIAVNDTITGGTSGATGVVERIVILKGAWGNATYPAEGILYITSKTGTWQNDEAIKVNGVQQATTNTGGGTPGNDASSITTGCWVAVPFTYWDYPQNIYNYNYNNSTTLALHIQIYNSDEDNYLRWGYTNDLSGDSNMKNSSSSNPPSQSEKDYLFDLWGSLFYFNEPPSGVLESPLYTVPSGITEYDRLYIVLNGDVLGADERKSKIWTMYYCVKSNPADPDVWVGINNGGKIAKTASDGLYFKYKVTFQRSTGPSGDGVDSVTVLSARLTWFTEVFEKTLMSAAIHEDRYIFNIYDINNPEQAPY